MSTIQEQCAERQIDPRIIDLISEFALNHTVARCITEVDSFRLSVDESKYAAVYPGVASMDLALDPEDAKSAGHRHGLRVTKTNPSTAYLRIPADFLDTADGRAVALELLDVAWTKAFHGERWEIRGAAGQAFVAGRVCPKCFIELPVSGECELCD